MPLKYNPTRDEEPTESSSNVWAFLCLIAFLAVCFVIYKVNQPPPPEPVVVAKPAPTPAPRLAKEGTFFMLEYISVHTKSGVIGFEPGREVHLVQVLKDKQKLLVSDGQYSAEVDPGQLTNNLDIAAIARVRDAASQNQLVAFQSAEKEKYEKARQEADMAHSKEIAQINARMSTGSMVGGASNPLNEAPKATGSVFRNYYDAYGTPYGTPYYSGSGNPYSYFYPTYR